VRSDGVRLFTEKNPHRCHRRPLMRIGLLMLLPRFNGDMINLRMSVISGGNTLSLDIVAPGFTRVFRIDRLSVVIGNCERTPTLSRLSQALAPPPD
jgi:hypothetical protein